MLDTMLKFEKKAITSNNSEMRILNIKLGKHKNWMHILYIAMNIGFIVHISFSSLKP